MEIIFANRKNCFEIRGGDTVQMEKTKEYLEKMYDDVVIRYAFTPQEILLNNSAKIIHIFNIQNFYETKQFIEVAKQKNLIIILSPIYWDLLDAQYINYLKIFQIYALKSPKIFKTSLINIFNFLITHVPTLKNKYQNTIKNGLYGSKKNKEIGRYILSNADYILPNSPEEGSIIEDYFKISLKENLISIPNAFDSRNVIVSNNDKIPALPENFILQVGRLETTKNQLNLIKALYNSPEIPLVFVGKCVDKKYYNKLQHHAKKRGNVFFINEVSHNEIKEIFKRAKVHVLASFRESPGLVSLEAKQFGCEIVVSDKRYCPIEYYQFDKLGFTCNPYNLKSIKNAVLKAYYHPKNTSFTEEYIKFFSYDNVAKMTYEVYLKSKKNKSISV